MANPIIPFPGQSGGWTEDTGGNSFQVVVEWYNPDTGQTVQAPNSGWKPPEGAGWEVGAGQAISTPSAPASTPESVSLASVSQSFQNDQFQLIKVREQPMSFGMSAQQMAELDAMKGRRFELSRNSLSGGSITDLWREIMKENDNG